MVAGGYDPIATRIFNDIDAQRLLLEYDDARSGTFDALREVPDDKIVVLGLVSTKTARQETQGELTARIREASRWVPLDRLALSPQCGFSSSIIGNRISVDDQKRKLRVIVQTAEAVWG
ncbi:MAG: vitamin-B12 independent methionine synthase [candidate division NC10 bacterium]|nr:vitamin-B12 independent methionine synthase [candidate division NC10 bacterium]